MHAALRLSHTCCHWLLVGSLMLAAGFGLDALWIHARIALTQWLDACAAARRGRFRRVWPRHAE
ncbi:hypothetical protein [Rhodanobacter lindaniclasticus]